MKHKLWIPTLALSLLLSPPAQAHDELVGQTPAEGQVVSAGIVDIRLEFSGELIALEDGSGNEISIVGPEGQTIYSGCLPTEGKFGLISADLDQVGRHTITWRAVSSDGHPISGTFGFEIENSSGYASDPNFAYPACASEPNLIMQQPDYYWLLWLSLGLAAAVVFFFLRPKKRPDISQ
jgi:methionine-rich copper-binding protein CopC